MVMRATVDEQIAPPFDETPFDLGSSWPGREPVQEDGDDTLILLFMLSCLSHAFVCDALTLRAVEV